MTDSPSKERSRDLEYCLDHTGGPQWVDPAEIVMVGRLRRTDPLCDSPWRYVYLRGGTEVVVRGNPKWLLDLMQARTRLPRLTVTVAFQPEALRDQPHYLLDDIELAARNAFRESYGAEMTEWELTRLRVRTNYVYPDEVGVIADVVFTNWRKA